MELHRHYPADMGILAPLILNLIKLEPGSAMNIASGQLHSYLHGMGIEIMANSDNVIRCGLTVKHIDIPELLKAVSFETANSFQKSFETNTGVERIYETTAREFILSEISLRTGLDWKSGKDRSAEILLCIAGSSVINFNNAEKTFRIKKGNSVLIPSGAPVYSISGECRLFRATVPLD